LQGGSQKIPSENPLKRSRPSSMRTGSKRTALGETPSAAPSPLPRNRRK